MTVVFNQSYACTELCKDNKEIIEARKFLNKFKSFKVVKKSHLYPR